MERKCVKTQKQKAKENERKEKMVSSTHIVKAKIEWYFCFIRLSSTLLINTLMQDMVN